jgi:hypothetical protein
MPQALAKQQSTDTRHVKSEEPTPKADNQKSFDGLEVEILYLHNTIGNHAFGDLL